MVNVDVPEPVLGRQSLAATSANPISEEGQDDVAQTVAEPEMEVDNEDMAWEDEPE